MVNSVSSGSHLVSDQAHTYTVKKPSSETISELAKAIQASASSYDQLYTLILEKSMPITCSDGVERRKFRQRYYEPNGVWCVDDKQIMGWEERNMDLTVFSIGATGEKIHFNILLLEDGTSVFHFDGDETPVSCNYDIVDILDVNSQFALVKRRLIKREQVEMVEEVVDGHLDQSRIFIGDTPHMIKRLPSDAILCADGVIRRNFQSEIRGEWQVAGQMFTGTPTPSGPGPNDWVAWEIDDIGKHGKRSRVLVETVKPLHTHADRKDRSPIVISGTISEKKRRRLVQKNGDPLTWAGGIVLDDEAPMLAEEYSAFESWSAPPTPLNVLDLTEGDIGVRYLHTDGGINNDPRKRPFSVRKFPVAAAKNLWYLLTIPFVFVYEFMDERGWLDRWKKDETVEEED